MLKHRRHDYWIRVLPHHNTLGNIVLFIQCIFGSVPSYNSALFRLTPCNVMWSISDIYNIKFLGLKFILCLFNFILPNWWLRPWSYQVVRMLVASLTCLVLLWGPRWVFGLVEYYHRNEIFRKLQGGLTIQKLLELMDVISFFSACVNPILYFIFST